MAKNTIAQRGLPLNALCAEGLAGHGRFTAAANALLIALERLLAVPLFERKPHAPALTQAGQYLLPAAARPVDRLEYALNDTPATHAAGACSALFCSWLIERLGAITVAASPCVALAVSNE